MFRPIGLFMGFLFKIDVFLSSLHMYYALCKDERLADDCF